MKIETKYISDDGNEYETKEEAVWRDECFKKSTKLAQDDNFACLDWTDAQTMLTELSFNYKISIP